MIKLNKASAGSGKTYTLAHTYIDLLGDELSFKHILAVTFTNKATAEMKERILEYLADEPELRGKLTRILHDYSAFSVSTIDKFFQQALKAFAREIGQVADYQVELDRDSLIAEAMDRILDSLTGAPEQDEILGWLKRNISDKLESGSSVNIDRSLHEMGIRLKNDERRQLRELHGVTDMEFDKARLARVRSSCREVIRKFAAEVKAAAAELPEYGNKHADAQRKAYIKAVWFRPIEYPKKTLEGKAAGTAFMELFGKPFEIYCTARLIEAQLFSLGLAREFFSQFDALLKEKNVLCLDDSNTLLKRIISGSDAPFVYEKLGVRYEHFLLDEFQDTSNIQWENFLPLLKESESNGHESLIVGDVKQSIYRWRDSDWRLLAEKVESEFPSARVVSMQENRRSCSRLVLFNNGFFEFAARKLGLDRLYSDVCQTVAVKDESQPGHVQVSFCDPDSEIEKVVESIETARAANALYKDIAVLVRNNAEGSRIAEALIAKGYPVVSDDSLKISSSSVVRSLLSLLSCLENPKDGINSFIAREAGIKIPPEYHSLVELCENLLRELQESSPEAFGNETLFIQAFMDELREWTEVNGNHLRYFLQHWADKEHYISSPENSNSITILTVHKSKGLEFPYLVFPFAEKVNLYRATEKWCWLDAAGTPFVPEVSGIYSVRLSEKTSKTLFADEYESEREMQKIDNMNIFYVALTRARCCLHIIASNPPKTYEPGNYKNFSQILFDFCGGLPEKEFGTMYDFSRLRRKAGKVGADFEAEYLSIDPAGRMKASEDASDFFGDDGSTGTEASPRRNGIVLHGILSRVQGREDLEGAVRDALLDGLINEAEAEDICKMLSARILAHPEFFGTQGFNEAGIFDSDGKEYRPDRVVVSGGSALVVDYKFGSPEDRYANQLRRYMKLYRELGYNKVEGRIWYVVPDRVVEV